MADIQIFSETSQAQKWLEELSNKIKTVENGASKFADVISAVVFQDVIAHFEKEEGIEGAWKPWSKMYAEHMRKIGKGGNKKLQDTGRLRQSFMPDNYRTVSEGILWYNPAKTGGGFPYAAAHDDGGDGLPKREFMWLGTKAMEKIETITLDYILGE